MKDNFMIREFQFYNAFEGYSRPPGADKDGWGTRFFNRPVKRNLLRVYTEEIAKIGGRSWLSIQAMATNPGDKELQNGFHKIGTHSIGGEALLDVVVPNAMWAERVAPHWAEFASSLGFTGIHWDTLGNYLGKQEEQDCDLAGFLKIASVLLRKYGLAQTLNFVDGFGWQPSLEADGLIAFPYWTAGPSQKERELVSSMDMHGGSVFMEFAKEAKQHDEWFKYLTSRWRRAHDGGSVYLAVGDGTHACMSDYLPASRPLTKAEVAAIREEVFTTCTLALCRQGAGVATTTQPCGGPKDMVEGELVLALQPTSDDVDPISSVAKEVVAIEGVLGQHFGFCAVRIRETLTARRRLGEGAADATKLRMAFTGSAPAGAAREAESAPTLALTQEFQAAFDRAHAGVNVQSASVKLNGGEPASGRVLAYVVVGGVILNILACCLLVVACRRRGQQAGAPQDDDKVPLTQAAAEAGKPEEPPMKDEEVRLCEAMEKSTTESSEGKEQEREGSETEQRETQGGEEAAEDDAEEKEAGEEAEQQEEEEQEEQAAAREEPGEGLAPDEEEKGEEESAAVQEEGKEDAAAEGSTRGEEAPEKGNDEPAHA